MFLTNKTERKQIDITKLRIDDYPKFFRMFNVTKVYSIESFFHPKNRAVFDLHGFEVVFDINEYYSFSFSRLNFQVNVIELFNNLTQKLERDEQKFIIDNYYDESYTNTHIFKEFFEYCISFRYKTMSSIIKQHLEFSNIRFIDTSKFEYAFIFDLPFEKNVSVFICDNLNSTLIFDSNNINFDLNHYLTHNFPYLNINYPDIHFRNFSRDTNDFKSIFYGAPAIKKYIEHPQYAFSSLFYDSKKIDETTLENMRVFLKK